MKHILIYILAFTACTTPVTSYPGGPVFTQPCAAIKFREFDANGHPLAGGKLYTYAAGTTTPLATYTSATGSVANANPIVLDAAGRADVWLTPRLLYKFVLKDSADVVQYTVDNFLAPSDLSSSIDIASIDPGGRLTLTFGTAVTTSDVTGATTIYYAPYKGSFVPIYDGTNWALWSIGNGLSQATTDTTKSPAAVVANSNYDLFVWNDANGLGIELSRGPAWTSATARGVGVGTTEIMQVNGKWVNKNAITNGPGAQLGLYVGTVRSDGGSQINDSLAKRHVWNAQNRVRRTMQVLETTNNWVYSAGTWRQANGQTTNQLDYVCGLMEDDVHVTIFASADKTGGDQSAVGQVAVGLDNATTPTGLYSLVIFENDIALSGFYIGIPGLGRHYLTWLELGQNIGTSTVTWYGVNTGNVQSGIVGSCMA